MPAPSSAAAQADYIDRFLSLTGGREFGAQAARIAFPLISDYIAGRSIVMRAEIETIVEEIKQSLMLLRRHL
jgi:hypothetical protein